MHRNLLLIALVIAFAAIVNSSEAAPEFGDQPPPKPELQKALADLNSLDYDTKLNSIMALAEFGPEAAPAIADLIATLGRTNDIWSFHAAFVLSKIGKEAVPELSKLLDNENQDKRYFALWSLGLIGPDAKNAASKVVELLQKDQYTRIQRTAANALSRMKPDPAAVKPALLKALANNEADVRRAAADALGGLGKPVVPDLVQAMNQGSPPARAAAMHALGIIGPDAKDAVGELTKILKGKDADLAAAAADALGQVSEETRPLLIDACKHDSIIVRLIARNSLLKLDGDSDTHLNAISRELPKGVAVTITETLASLAVAEKLKAVWFANLVLGPQNPDTKIVNGYAEILALGSAAAPAVPLLIAGLKYDDLSTRIRCATILGNIGPAAKAAVPALTNTLADTNAKVRTAAKQALAKIGPK